MADDTRNGRLAASLSILCAVAATLMPTASQMVYARSAPDSNAYFGVLLLMPALYLAGLGWLSWRGEDWALATGWQGSRYG